MFTLAQNRANFLVSFSPGTLSRVIRGGEAKMKLLTRGRLVAAVGIMALAVVLVARGMNSGKPARVSFPNDWSHRHVVFSQPATALQASQLQKEPRYWQQMLRRNAAGLRRIGAAQSEERIFAGLRQRSENSSSHRDWAESLGPGATTGTANFPQFPAKFTFSTDPNDELCSDYAAFPTNVPGVTGTSGAPAGQPSIIAYTNLYVLADGSGPCGGPDPAIAWAYNTNAAGDTTGVVSGSPVISFDGTKVAFVESNAGGSVLHLLQYTVGDGTDVGTSTQILTVTPTNLLLSGSGWNACPTDGSSCMISLTFSASTASNSSPFYNFSLDELYLGDDNGVLHKFTGVFSGTPTEVTTGWPITVHAGVSITPPVFDAGTRNVFVGDAAGVLSFVKDTGSVTGACAIGVPPCLGSTTILASSLPIVDPPMLDPSTGKVFAFVGDNGAVTLPTGRHAYVVQANEDLTGLVRVNVGAPGAHLHSGAFDNAYLTSSAGSTAGHLYVCGKAGTDRPAIRQISFRANGSINTAGLNSLQVGNNAGSQCSPVTEIFNPNIGVGTDLIFFSVQSGGRSPIGGIATNCLGTGCVMSIDVTSGTFPAHLNNSLGETGGTSGIIIDNVGTFGGDSSIYFSRLGQSTLTNCGGSGAALVGCAVKLTQQGFN
jgi:hypothetical protein